jgi:CheY-like chemotaxis protein
MNASLAHEAPRARILVVDDEPDNRELLQIVLKWDGFDIQLASSGGEALTSIAEQPPDLILLDLMMPGLDGCQVTVELKRNPTTRHIPVMIISAMNDRATRERVLDAGAEAFITKPIDRSELCEQVRNLLRLSQPPTESA